MKLHNIAIDEAVAARRSVAFVQPCDLSPSPDDVLFPIFQSEMAQEDNIAGARRDLEHAPLRQRLTEDLASKGMERPTPRVRRV